MEPAVSCAVELAAEDEEEEEEEAAASSMSPSPAR